MAFLQIPDNPMDKQNKEVFHVNRLYPEIIPAVAMSLAAAPKQVRTIVSTASLFCQEVDEKVIQPQTIDIQM